MKWQDILAMRPLKFQLVPLNTQFPILSAFVALIHANSACSNASSSKYSLPLNSLVSRFLLYAATLPSELYFIGNLPSAYNVWIPVTE